MLSRCANLLPEIQKWLIFANISSSTEHARDQIRNFPLAKVTECLSTVAACLMPYFGGGGNEIIIMSYKHWDCLCVKYYSLLSPFLATKVFWGHFECFSLPAFRTFPNFSMNFSKERRSNLKTYNKKCDRYQWVAVVTVALWEAICEFTHKGSCTCTQHHSRMFPPLIPHMTKYA